MQFMLSGTLLKQFLSKAWFILFLIRTVFTIIESCSEAC